MSDEKYQLNGLDLRSHSWKGDKNENTDNS